MGKNLAPVSKIIDSYGKEMVSGLIKITGINSVAPVNGGPGEKQKALFLAALLKSMGFRPKIYKYKDKYDVCRPNLIFKHGKGKKTIWIVSHTDTVSAGDLKTWKTPPFKGVMKGERIYGRGTNDNGQSIIASIYALKALADSGIKLKFNFGIALVADEENGSDYGITKLVEEGVFGKKDMFVVPDLGSQSERGGNIEISEKGLAWFRITVKGKQVHASTPQKGVNAYRYLIRFLADLEIFLAKKYNKENKLFNPPYSTFEFTKHDKNFDSINIISGSETSYMDCRILPYYKPEEIYLSIKKFAASKKYRPAVINVELLDSGKPTLPISTKSEMYVMLDDAVREVIGKKPRPMGMGAATVARRLRLSGWPVVVWSIADDVPHQPNEYANINDMMSECKIFAYLFI